MMKRNIAAIFLIGILLALGVHGVKEQVCVLIKDVCVQENRTGHSTGLTPMAGLFNDMVKPIKKEVSKKVSKVKKNVSKAVQKVTKSGK